MNIQIKSTNIELTEAIKDYLEEKLQGAEKILNAEETEPLAEVELGKETNHHQSGDALYFAETNLEVGGSFYRSRSQASELYAAIDTMKDEIMREIRRDKEKKRSLMRRGALKVKHMIRGFHPWRRK